MQQFRLPAWITVSDVNIVCAIANSALRVPICHVLHKRNSSRCQVSTDSHIRPNRRNHRESEQLFTLTIYCIVMRRRSGIVVTWPGVDGRQTAFSSQ